MQNNKKEELINKICSDILGKMKSDHYEVDHVLEIKWINLIYAPKLNPNERQYLNDSINSLINNGFVSYTNRLEGGIILTQKGFDFIYKN